MSAREPRPEVRPLRIAEPPTTLEEGRQAVRLRHLRPDLPKLGWTVMHIGLVAMMAWWAGLLALPIDTFDSAPGYAAFQRICPDENYWATGFGITALFGIWGLMTRLNWVRVSSTLLLGINHGMIAILMARGNHVGTGQGIYAIIMLMAYALAAREAHRAI